MSDDTFIARWSRRKRKAERERRRDEAPGTSPREARARQPAAVQRPAVAPGSTRPAAEPPFDPATLPPVDSIVAGSDIRAFLQKNVPAELTKAALRRAWSTDPAIRDFIGLAENQWDFTNPAGVPGFGPLEATTGAARQLVAQAMGKLPEEPGCPAEESRPSGAALAEQHPPPVAEAEPAGTPLERDDTGNDDIGNNDTMEIAAPQHPDRVEADDSAPRRKGHGAAMPR